MTLPVIYLDPTVDEELASRLTGIIIKHQVQCCRLQRWMDRLGDEGEYVPCFKQTEMRISHQNVAQYPCYSVKVCPFVGFHHWGPIYCQSSCLQLTCFHRGGSVKVCSCVLANMLLSNINLIQLHYVYTSIYRWVDASCYAKRQACLGTLGHAPWQVMLEQPHIHAGALQVIFNNRRSRLFFSADLRFQQQPECQLNLNGSFYDDSVISECVPNPWKQTAYLTKAWNWCCWENTLTPCRVDRFDICWTEPADMQSLKHLTTTSLFSF